ncbi:MAG: hypothetical protein FD138_3638 [Planctomycetota bacterium]|nr:MAG: hypothetical protein FD138_3638 [Planctomycetota bacterium]
MKRRTAAERAMQFLSPVKDGSKIAQHLRGTKQASPASPGRDDRRLKLKQDRGLSSLTGLALKCWAIFGRPYRDKDKSTPFDPDHPACEYLGDRPHAADLDETTRQLFSELIGNFLWSRYFAPCL